MHASVKFTLSAVVALALATPVLAQDARRPTSGASSSGSSASPRGGGSSAGSPSSGGGSTMSSPRGGSGMSGTAVRRPSREPRSARRPAAQAGGGTAVVPSYSRPRGDNSVRGQAVDRGRNPLPGRGDNYYYNPYGYYGYYNPYSPYYGYGLYPVYTGFGFFYYDPFWARPYQGHYGGYGAYYYEDDRDDRDYNIGSIRLKVDPKHGEVFVDGLYRGVVDDFDGIFQRLKLEAGAHRLEIRAEGFEPLVFDVLVTPGETTTYRGDLKR